MSGVSTGPSASGRVPAPAATMSRVPLSRIAWIATVVVCVVAAILLFVSDYTGYAFLALAVGASAAINLL
jgi:hypothetical protein